MDSLLQSAANDMGADAEFETQFSIKKEKPKEKEDGPIKAKSAIDVLRDSVEQVTKEERIEVDKAFGKVAKVIEEEIKPKIEESHSNYHDDFQEEDYDEPPVSKKKDYGKVVEKEEEEEEAPTKKPSQTKSHEKHDEDADEHSHSDRESEGEAYSEAGGSDDDASVTPAASSGCDPLILASYKGAFREVSTLIREGASCFRKDRHGWTALHWACAKGFDEVAEVILKNCSRAAYLCNLADSICGWTPMHVACINGNVRVVVVLLNFGSKKKKKNKLGEKPIDCILESHSNFKAIDKLLR